MNDVFQLDLREQIARIDRMRDESDKFRAEQQKLIAVSLQSQRDPFHAPWLAIAASIGGALGLATFVSRLLGQ